MWSDFQLPEEFSWADKGRIRELTRYLIGGQFQELVYRSRTGRKPVDIDILEKIVDLSHDRAMKFLRNLKRYNVLQEITYMGQDYLIMNPKYGLQKRRLHPIVYRVFKNDLENLLPPYVINNYNRVLEEKRYYETVKIKK